MEKSEFIERGMGLSSCIRNAIDKYWKDNECSSDSYTLNISLIAYAMLISEWAFMTFERGTSIETRHFYIDEICSMAKAHLLDVIRVMEGDMKHDD